MGAVNTTYTFTPTDTITSTKMNNIIDETVMTSDAVLGGSGGSGGLDISSGKLSISANAINSSRLAANSVTSTNIVDGTIVNADISPTAAIAGTKVSPAFGSQEITGSGNLVLVKTASDITTISVANTSGVQVNVNAIQNTEGNIRTTTNHPLTLSTNNTERMRISAAGNVGVGLTSLSSKLGILSSTSNATPEGGAHGIAIQAGDGGKEMNMGYDSSVDIGYINASKAGSLRPVVLQSRGGTVGIGKTNPSTLLDVNGTVTATGFAGPLTGNVTGNVTGTATTATTVSNGAITAAKLNGAQGGSAPIYGIRAWVNFNGRVTNGNCEIRSSGNVSSVSRVAQGKYVVNFAEPMQGTGYTVVASAGTSPGSPRFACADRSTAATGSIKIETDNQSGAAADFNENNVMVIG